MKWTSLNDLREKYLAFFESKGHLRLPSFSLIPNNDKSLLLINSGMAPMKKYFTGEEVPPRTRVCTCQKCIRTPDLERVGHTARHGTYFEMLGNFSFGDYFKNEAIAWSWEFLNGTLEIPAELLWPSVYEGDDEAYAIWRDKVGVPEEHIVRLGKADNFWEHGSGPCGPCSEIYLDRGEKYGCGSPDCKPGCDCDRFMEIWNNVFSQFNNDGAGNYTELIQKNIDTGMGLERLACVMQGVDNLFEVDTVRKILDTVCAISEKTYGKDAKNDVSIRVVTDHIRSATFMICDGVIPSNEGRGYVLRRIIRRACRHGKLLGINRMFLKELCEVVISQNDKAYPELVEKRDYILKVVVLEEERFNATIDAGLGILNGIVAELRVSGGKVISGEDAFKLYDTFGFPVDLTREIAEEAGLSVDNDAFAALMDEQKQRARAARGNISGWSDSSKDLLESLPETEFVGYDSVECEATLLSIIADGENVESINEGECSLVFDKTVFYGEGGGQVGDTGVITSGGATLTVLDTKKTNGIYIHEVKIEAGSLKKGDVLTLKIDTARRLSIKRNHSAAHLLQAALRQVLGSHVEQAGSYVDEHRVRFDFTHLSAMTKEEIAKVEAIVNANILMSESCSTEISDIESARKKGAMALFGEKYGDKVRVVSIGSSSVELCGGTHVSSTGEIGLFKVISESSVAAGVRRIEGTTGLGVLALLAEKDELINETAKELKAQNPQTIAKKASALQAEIKETKRELDSANAKLSEIKTQSLLDGIKSVGKFKLLVAKIDARADEARGLCDSVKAKFSDGVAVFAAVSDSKLNFVCAAGQDAVKAGAHAGKIVGEIAAICGGKGGGRPDSAMSGGRDLNKIDEALARAEEILKNI
ncbi:MAG: alanine--tRNA ligase [Ruminococcaceae bacterium]|nr:alanine--tRNA ligase [Oscillospiraceae bacterium]